MNPAFGRCIEDVHRFLARMEEKGRRIRETTAPGNPRDSGLRSEPASIRGSAIVLKSDTFLELGSPAWGSCVMTLYGEESEARRGDRITLVGPDIEESPSSQLPFGQVVIVRGDALTDEDYSDLVHRRIALQSLDGYMVRSTAGRIWSRISHDAARNGFCFEILGAALIGRIKRQTARISSVEVAFVTSSADDVAELRPIAERAREASEAIKETVWRQRGVDIRSCGPGPHCGACDDEDTCLEIRKIGAERKRTAKSERATTR
ncbi:carbon monoxide dehydrogenase [Candidatus Bipolaricaulota bacterium]|nr:carbon monoxide dehydrogenase [Candidatus Bipolaricaulota bacterium]